MISIEKMPTAVTADKHPIHNWFNFVAGYAPEYVEKVIDDFEKENGYKARAIYDPFAGCGTTGVVANNYRIRNIGVERNPFFFRVGYTKVHASETIVFLDEIYDEFLAEVRNGNAIEVDVLEKSAKEYLTKLFDTEVLMQLLQLRELVKSFTGMKYYMGFTFLSKLMEYATTAKTDGIYKVPTSTKKALSVIDAIEKAYSTIDIEEVTDATGEFVFDSSIDYIVEENSIDLVIFSPPYLNNFDFAEMTRMYLYFWEDASSWGDISEKHRNKMLVNTTTALKLVKSKEKQLEMKSSLPQNTLDKVEPIVDKLEAIRKENSKKKEYYLIIYPYLAQMRETLQHCFDSLRINGEIHIVVSDAAFYGIHIDTQDYLVDILEDIGFRDVKYIRMRDRGDRWVLEKRKSSGKQLGEFEIIGKKV